ncbi:TPA: site-specific DNA-methyltransferase [Legionella pneumophila]|nr:site-specific DNA-methyltransferase [Legionella pneumophila]
MSKYDELVRKLKEIFQIDKPELDFGIYRILNARADEINDYLENRLKIKIHDLLVSAGTANFDQIQKELQEAEKNAFNLGVSPDSVPKVQELRRKIEDVNISSAEYENSVFSHLLNFFSRYYDSGDFISKRRYKGNTYSIPYAGEEVLLHWANKDQYYIKSSENFSNYTFRLDDGRRVSFHLMAADTAKDNCKDNTKERCFALIEPQTSSPNDNNDCEDKETILPIEEFENELVLRFEYKIMPKGTTQEDLLIKAIEIIQDEPFVKKNWKALNTLTPTEKNQQRTLLEKNIYDYAQKNTADYFIHKDLESFLCRELDFYIKNEILHLDDVQNARNFSDIEQNLRLIQTLRAVGDDLITFLAQLEEFQKKLWLKKKFIVAAHYYITLDRIPESLYAQILTNSIQWEQWDKLGMLDDKKIKTIEYMRTHPFLMVDTSLYDIKFKHELLKVIDNLDESLDGLLVHGDNFQALNLLKASYKNQVNCVYIDPPYNAKTSEILYKNTFKHSSWLSLMQNRIGASKDLLNSDNYVYVIAIDEVEQEVLGRLIDEEFIDNNKNCITVIHNATGQQGNNFSYVHEFAYFIYPEKGKCIGLENREDNPDIRPLRNVSTGKHLRTDAANCFYPIFIKNGEIIGFGDICEDAFHPEGRNIFRSDGVIEVYPIGAQGEERKWVFARQSVESIKSELTAELDKKSGAWDIIRKKTRFNYKSVWSGSRYSANSYGSRILNEIMGETNFLYPKSIFTVQDSIDASLKNLNKGLVLDYFAGSGTTAHAIINLNRSDNGTRKYILVEQGEYFDTVTKPRIQKVIYSSGWKNGKPLTCSQNSKTTYTGSSHAFKVLKIESYEDTLNNLELRRNEAQQNLLNSLNDAVKEDYLLRYLIHVESRNSLLSIEHFNRPFDYTLKVAIDSSGACEEHSIDLLETFNYLIGLRVKNIDIQRNIGIAKITGWLPTGEYTLILWRDVEQIDYQALNELCEKIAISPLDSEFEVVYINGDHNIPAVLTTNFETGGVTRSLKLRQIEPEFLTLMFSLETIQ